jgi:hypothetical protein
MSNVLSGPLPSYAVDLLLQAKTVLTSIGTPNQEQAISQLRDAIISFEEQMPVAKNLEIWEVGRR